MMDISYSHNLEFFKYAGYAYLIAFVLYLIYMITKSRTVGYTATLATAVGAALHTFHFGYRWWESYQIGSGFGHIPLSNLFESMSFAAWTIVLLYLIFEWKYKKRSFGVFVTPVVLLAMAYVGFAIPQASKQIEPLVPALQSYWLHIHVITSFLGYAAFAISFAVGIMYLIVATGERKVDSLKDVYFSSFGGVMRFLFMLINAFPYLLYDIYTFSKRRAVKEGGYVFWVVNISGVLSTMMVVILSYYLNDIFKIEMFDSTKYALVENGASIVTMSVIVVCIIGMAIALTLLTGGHTVKSRLVDDFKVTAEILDEVSYKSIMIGFPLLTLGIITGAVWANEAWGTYWSWDPKETWSLITWFVYAAYLHARYTRGWAGQRAAVIAVCGFLAVIFTFLGVNILLSGLHSYAALGNVNYKTLTFLTYIFTLF